MPELHLFFAAKNDQADLLLTSSSDGTHWSPNRRLRGATEALPAATATGANAFVGFVEKDTNGAIQVSDSGSDFAPHPIDESSSMGPALAVLNNLGLYMAFVANNPTGNLLGILLPGAGTHAFDNNVRINQTSKRSPALTAFNNNLHVAFVANNDTNSLLVVQSRDGEDWSHNTPVNQTSKEAPALAVFNGQLHMAFVANDDTNNLLVVQSRDGVNWSGNTRVNQTSKTPPAMAVF